jgi:hypothetical protein
MYNTAEHQYEVQIWGGAQEANYMIEIVERKQEYIT